MYENNIAITETENIANLGEYKSDIILKEFDGIDPALTSS